MSVFPEQLDLDFGAPAEDGYAIWQWQRKQALQRVSKEWGLPLEQPVRLRLTGIDGEFVGILRLNAMPTTLDRKLPLQLRMDHHVFESTEIEFCSLDQT